MYCHKCGSKLQEGDKFCGSCGASVETHPVSEKGKRKKLTRESLRDRAWYRALKVVYICLLALVLLCIAGIAYGSKPQKELDANLSTISCNNGFSYPLAKNNIYVFGPELSDSDDQDARILCAYDTTNYFSHLGEYIPKNYAFNAVYKPMDYGSWIGGIFISLIATWVVFALVRFGFYYIVVG